MSFCIVHKKDITVIIMHRKVKSYKMENDNMQTLTRRKLVCYIQIRPSILKARINTTGREEYFTVIKASVHRKGVTI